MDQYRAFEIDHKDIFRQINIYLCKCIHLAFLEKDILAFAT